MRGGHAPVVGVGATSRRPTTRSTARAPSCENSPRNAQARLRFEGGEVSSLSVKHAFVMEDNGGPLKTFHGAMARPTAGPWQVATKSSSSWSRIPRFPADQEVQAITSLDYNVNTDFFWLPQAVSRNSHACTIRVETRRQFLRLRLPPGWWPLRADPARRR